MRFKSLLLKEIKQVRSWLLYGSLIVCAYEATLFIKTNKDAPYWSALTVAPLIMIAFAIQFRITGALRREWKDNSVQLLFSLPIRGYHFISTKFLAQTFIVCSYSLLSLIFLLLVLEFKLDSTAGINLFEILKCWLFFLLFPLSGMAFFIFSYLVGRYSPHLKGLVSVLSFFALVWTFQYIFPWGEKLFRFLPKAGITVIRTEGTSTASFNPAGIAFFALFGFILLVASCFMVERIEI